MEFSDKLYSHMLLFAKGSSSIDVATRIQVDKMFTVSWISDMTSGRNK